MSKIEWAVIVVAGVAYLFWLGLRLKARSYGLRVVGRHRLPAFIRHKLMATYPHLTDRQAHDVERGLRQFFRVNLQAQGRFVAMPSKAVDTLWHEFILHTRSYEIFCRQAFGRLLHHTPAAALPTLTTGKWRNTVPNEGLRRAWRLACGDEHIDPQQPARLPLLFALDASLGIEGGYVYALDCAALGADRGGTQCASDLGSRDGSGGGGGDVGSSSSHDDGHGGDGGGDGGGGGGDGGGCGGD